MLNRVENIVTNGEIANYVFKSRLMQRYQKASMWESSPERVNLIFLYGQIRFKKCKDNSCI